MIRVASNTIDGVRVGLIQKAVNNMEKDGMGILAILYYVAEEYSEASMTLDGGTYVIKLN